MKLLITVVIIISTVGLSFQIYSLNKQKKLLQNDLNKIESKLQPLLNENGELLAEIKYLKNDDNLEKELRSRFNYVKPGEKLIIVVPESQ
jgi:cell division protein FtsB